MEPPWILHAQLIEQFRRIHVRTPLEPATHQWPDQREGVHSTDVASRELLSLELALSFDFRIQLWLRRWQRLGRLRRPDRDDLRLRWNDLCWLDNCSRHKALDTPHVVPLDLYRMRGTDFSRSPRAREARQERRQIRLLQGWSIRAATVGEHHQLSLQRSHFLEQLQGLSQKEIAARLGISENTVEKQVSNAMRRFTAHVSAFMNSPVPGPEPALVELWQIDREASSWLAQLDAAPESEELRRRIRQWREEDPRHDDTYRFIEVLWRVTEGQPRVVSLKSAP